MSHPEILQNISASDPLAQTQHEFLLTNPPTNTDVVANGLIQLNSDLIPKRNTRCPRCSPTGVFSNKQVIVQAAGSTLIYDPEKYSLEDRNSNPL